MSELEVIKSKNERLELDLKQVREFVKEDSKKGIANMILGEEEKMVIQKHPNETFERSQKTDVFV